MKLRSVALAAFASLLLAPAVLGLHSAGDGSNLTDTGPRTLYVQLATAVWWDHSQVRGTQTGLSEQTAMFEINNLGGDVIVTAETFPINTPDTPKQCLPVTTPMVFPAPAGTAILHPTSCVKENGYTVQVHYFPWETGINDPDHVISITPSTPLATTAWRVDAVPTSYKTAVVTPGHWTVWIDPAVSPGEYDIVYRAQSANGAPFYFDYLGTRGCPFHAVITTGVGDGDLLGCQSGFV